MITRKSNQTKTILSLVINLLLFLITTGVIISYFFTESEHVKLIIHSQEEVFWFFTTDSNIFAAVAALIVAICDIRILRGKADRLPKAVMILKFAATATVMLTLTVCLVYLAPRFGFGFIFGDSFFHVHLSGPLMAFVSLCFFDKGERISFPAACWSYVPLAIYGAVYTTMVTVIGEENGGWRDLYRFTDGGSIWLTVVLMLVLYTIIVIGQRAVYNIGLGKKES